MINADIKINPEGILTTVALCAVFVGIEEGFFGGLQKLMVTKHNIDVSKSKDEKELKKKARIQGFVAGAAATAAVGAGAYAILHNRGN